MNRTQVIQTIEENPDFDFIIIGGGATGIGTALDATLRGFRTLLLEKSDFTKGTSSRSTKLVHGGVRYLAQGNVYLVLEALRERGYLKHNAPHLVRDQEFIIPNYRWWEGIFYTIGLTLYDLMAGRLSFGRSIHLNSDQVKKDLPGINEKGLKGGVLYHDGQFDDSRLAIDILHSVFEQGGFAINYFPAITILKDISGKINGISARDDINGKVYQLKSRIVINATGVWVDDILKMDHPETEKLVIPSQGVHLVLDKKFLPGPFALMIPKTDDGRVLFAVPWHDHLVVGTTDTPLEHALEEPVAMEKEIDFILNTAGRYFKTAPKKEDVLTVFAGLRPLSAPKKSGSGTKEISRSHKIIVSLSGLVTITGGKWTTYRKMALDVVDKAIKITGLKYTPSLSKEFKISGYSNEIIEGDPYSVYGSRRENILDLVRENPDYGKKLHPDLTYIIAEVIWICRNEMAIKLEDMLARRLRVLFLNARAAVDIAPDVAGIMAKELNWSEEKIKNEISDFKNVAKNYIL
jgi:glycerol-3-phosphate dehydrogenase